MGIRLGAFMEGYVDEQRRTDKASAEAAKASAKARDELKKQQIAAEKEERRRFEVDRTYKSTERHRHETRTHQAAVEARQYLDPYLKGQIKPFVEESTKDPLGADPQASPEIFLPHIKAQAFIASKGNPVLANAMLGAISKKYSAEKTIKSREAREKYEEKLRKERDEKRREETHERAGTSLSIAEQRLVLAQEEAKRAEQRDAREEKLRKEGDYSEVVKKVIAGKVPLNGNILNRVIGDNKSLKKSTLLDVRRTELEKLVRSREGEEKGSSLIGREYPIFSKAIHSMTQGHEGHFLHTLNPNSRVKGKQLDYKKPDHLDTAYLFLQEAESTLKNIPYLDDDENLQDVIKKSALATDIKRSLTALSMAAKENIFNFDNINTVLPTIYKYFQSEGDSFEKQAAGLRQEEKQRTEEVAKTVNQNGISINPSKFAEASTYTTATEGTQTIQSVAERGKVTLDRLDQLPSNVKVLYNTHLASDSVAEMPNRSAAYDAVFSSLVKQRRDSGDFSFGQNAENSTYDAVMLGAINFMYKVKGGTAQNRSVEIDIVGKLNKDEVTQLKKEKEWEKNTTVFNSSLDGMREINRVLALFTKASDNKEGYKNIADSVYRIPATIETFKEQAKNFISWWAGESNDINDSDLQNSLRIINTQGRDDLREHALNTIKEARIKSRQALEARKDQGVSEEDYLLYQRIEMAKVKLAYKMAGVFQGASSGSRTISDADFRIILEALWGNTQKGTTQKLLELRSTLNTEFLLAKSYKELAPITRLHNHVTNRLQQALKVTRESVLAKELETYGSQNMSDDQKASDTTSSPNSVLDGIKITSRDLKPDSKFVTGDIINITPGNYNKSIRKIVENHLISAEYLRKYVGDDLEFRPRELLEHFGVKDTNSDPRQIGPLIETNATVMQFIKPSNKLTNEILSTIDKNEKDLNEFTEKYYKLQNKSIYNIRELSDRIFGKGFFQEIFNKREASFNREYGIPVSKAIANIYIGDMFLNSISQYNNLDGRISYVFSNDKNEPTLKEIKKFIKSLKSLPTDKIEKIKNLRDQLNQLSTVIGKPTDKYSFF